MQIYSITFQIWRPTGSRGKFILLGENTAIPMRNDDYFSYNVTKSEQVRVLPGDMIGIRFKGGNLPIPFDYTNRCENIELFIYNKVENETLPGKGSLMEFQTKEDRHECKIYSLFAKIEKRGQCDFTCIN